MIWRNEGNPLCFSKKDRKRKMSLGQGENAAEKVISIADRPQWLL